MPHTVEREWLITPNNLIWHELIGLNIQIISSPRVSEIGLQGAIIDETKYTIILCTPKKRCIVKNGRKLCFIIGSKKIIVNGNKLIGRPEERIKIKNWKKG